MVARLLARNELSHKKLKINPIEVFRNETYSTSEKKIETQTHKIETRKSRFAVSLLQLLHFYMINQCGSGQV